MSLLSKVKDIFKSGSSTKKKKVYHNVKLDDPDEIWEVIGELGDGAYGKVYKAQHRNTGKLAALKQVDLEGEDDLDTFMVEIEILLECRHPNVVELLEAYHFDGKLWMYLEYCDGGAVDSIMVDLDRALNEPQIALLCYHLCNALVYIHTNKVIHRDLKAGNVLLTMDGGVKLADFGVSAKNKNTYDKRGTFIGTPYWLAPEVILCETFIDAKYDYKADIWSLGISLIEFAQMDPPNHEVSPVRVMLKIQKSDPPKLDFPSKWSKEFNDFIARCLTKDPVLRPTAEDLLKHPFLSKPLDKKPIIDLLLEYKAEVVEEDVEDENEDHDQSRASSVPERFPDPVSIISNDKENTISGKLLTPTLEDKEANLSASDKRISKKPAPPPPVVNANSQFSPKKGPAPAVPSPPLVSSPTTSSANVAPTDTSNAVPGPDKVIAVSISTPVSAVTVSDPTSSTNSSTFAKTNLVSSAETVTTSTIITSPDLPQPSIGSVVSVSDSNSTTSTTSSKTTKVTNDPFPSGSSPDKHIPSELKETDSKTPEEIFIDSIPIGKSVNVYKSDVYDEMITVNNTSVSETVIIESTSQTVIKTDTNKTSNQGVTVELETKQQSSTSDEGKKLSIVTSESSVISSPELPPTSAPVTLSVISPDSSSFSALSDNNKSQGSDMLLASISSEGTVIVRTPTPTNVDSSGKPTKKSENIVTYTVAKDANIDSTLDLESAISQSHEEESHPSLSSDESQVADKQPNSLGEAEAQAVFILETAINSAMDSSLSGVDYLEPIQGEVVVIASEKVEPGNETLELDNSIKDISGHKLDESEVLITSSSIPEDEEKESEKSVESSPTEDQPSLNESFAASEGKEEAHHVSVVSVDEGKEEVTIVSKASTTKGEVVVDGPETTQMSLTIEGTTLEDTDVDEVENSTSSSAVSTLSEKRTQERESVISTTENKKEKLVNVISSASTIPSSPSMDESDPSHPVPLQPIQNGIRRQNSRASDRSDSDTTSTVGSDKENRQLKEDFDASDEVTLRRGVVKANASPVLSNNDTAAKNLKNKELQASIALRKKTRKRTRKFVIDGVVVTTTTSKVIYGDDEEQGMLSSAHLARKQELRELKLVQKREQKQFQDLALKANIARLEQEKKFEIEKANLLRNYDSQIENLIRQQKQLVEKAENRQESELKIESKKTRIDQERELKAFRESLKQEWKLLKQEVDLLPKDKRKENFKIRKEQLERDQTEREKACLERLNDSHEMALKRLNDKHRKHIALKERQFLEEKHQLLRARESALWDMEERHIQDKHQLAKEQLKDIYFLQRLQMTIRHNVELEQVRRFNQQKEEDLLKRQHEERRQLPKRIRQEMKTREKMFREQIRISMTQLPSHEQEKDQIKRFQEQEKIKYDKERKRAEMKHKKQMEELTASTDSSIKELVHLQNEKGKLLTEHETYKLKSLDEEYQKELRDWKSNLAPRKQKLEEDFERQLREQENFYGEYLERGLGLCIPAQSTSSLTSTHH